MTRLILASGSPRRRDTLERLGFEHTVRPVDLDETPHAGEAPRDYVLRLAQAKADAEAHPGELVLAADTTVVLDGEILGKPEGAADACRLLRRISGRVHQVLTGLALRDVDRDLGLAVVESTAVKIAALSDREIEWYVATSEPLDKAGAYGAQGLGSYFVESVEGDYSNVVGLPIPTLYRLLRRMGYSFPNLP